VRVSGWCTALFPPDQPQNKGQEEADQKARGKGKIKGNMFSPEMEISREPPEPGNFAGKKQDNSQNGDYASDNDQELAQLRQGCHG